MSCRTSPHERRGCPAQASLRSLRKLGCEAGHDGSKMKRIGILPLITILFAFAPSPAFTQTCGWARETVTFLAKLPPAGTDEAVVAEVEVVKMLSAQPGVEWFFSHLVLARVVTPLKGVEAGQDIIVNTRDTLCDQTLSSGAIGRRYFIAGRFIKTETGETHFTGRWKRDLASGGMVRDAD